MDEPYLGRYASERDFETQSPITKRYISIGQNYSQSRQLLDKLTSALQTAESRLTSTGVKTVIAAGSIGRMEASPDVSDADLIVVLDNSCSDQKKAFDAVWAELEAIKIERPKPTGLFGSAILEAELLDNVGGGSEDLPVFGKRLLILLESQPVFGRVEFNDLITSVVNMYATLYTKSDASKEWVLLLNDLIRYFRSLAVNYQWDLDNDPRKWPLRNMKLRHSRVIMYAGLLFLLGEASKEQEDKVKTLLAQLHMTPLERIAWVYKQNNDRSFHRVIGLYDVFLTKLNQPSVRESLLMEYKGDKSDLVAVKSAATVYYENRYSHPEFSALKANSDGLIAELLRFVMARRGDWSERFFEYLIF